MILIAAYLIGVTHYNDKGYWGRDRLPTLLGVRNHHESHYPKYKYLPKNQYFWYALQWPYLLLNYKWKQLLKLVDDLKESYEEYKKGL